MRYILRVSFIVKHSNGIYIFNSSYTGLELSHKYKPIFDERNLKSRYIQLVLLDNKMHFESVTRFLVTA